MPEKFQILAEIGANLSFASWLAISFVLAYIAKHFFIDLKILKG